jgi:hypothetical protein
MTAEEVDAGAVFSDDGIGLLRECLFKCYLIVEKKMYTFDTYPFWLASSESTEVTVSVLGLLGGTAGFSPRMVLYLL